MFFMWRLRIVIGDEDSRHRLRRADDQHRQVGDRRGAAGRRSRRARSGRRARAAARPAPAGRAPPSAIWATISSRTAPWRTRVDTGTPRRLRVRALPARKRSARVSAWVPRAAAGSTVRIVTSAPRWRARRPENETSSLPGSPTATQISSRAGRPTSAALAGRRQQEVVLAGGEHALGRLDARRAGAAAGSPGRRGGGRPPRRPPRPAPPGSGASPGRRGRRPAPPAPPAGRARPRRPAVAGPSTATRAWARRAISPPSARAARERAGPLPKAGQQQEAQPGMHQRVHPLHPHPGRIPRAGAGSAAPGPASGWPRSTPRRGRRGPGARSPARRGAAAGAGAAARTSRRTSAARPPPRRGAGRSGSSGESRSATSSGRKSTCTRRARAGRLRLAWRAGTGPAPAARPSAVASPTIRLAVPRKVATNSVSGRR